MIILIISWHLRQPGLHHRRILVDCNCTTLSMLCSLLPPAQSCCGHSMACCCRRNCDRVLWEAEHMAVQRQHVQAAGGAMWHSQSLRIEIHVRSWSLPCRKQTWQVSNTMFSANSSWLLWHLDSDLCIMVHSTETKVSCMGKTCYLQYHHKVSFAQSNAAAIISFASPSFTSVWTTIGAIKVSYNNHTHAWPKAGLGLYFTQPVCSSLMLSIGQNMACPLLSRACAWGTHLGSEVLSKPRSNAACESSYSSSNMCC